jgi:molecular chaperone GrpE
VFLIRTQLEDILKRYGLERIMVSVGQEFDPSVHDAIVTVETQQPPGTIIEEVERGYMLNGKLIRAARVKVSK